MSNFTVFQNTQFEELIDAIKSGGGGGSYTLPPATTETLGGVKVGNNLSVTEDGTLSATSTITPATTTNLGGVKVGSGLAITSEGTLSATGGGGGGSSLVFSTEETEVGTWINGKTLYQKSYQFQTPTTFTDAVLTYNLGLYDIDDFMIDISHSFLIGKYVSAVRRNPNINLRSGNTNAESQILNSSLNKNLNTNELLFQTRIDNSGNYLNCTIFLTVQYTKSN